MVPLLSLLLQMWYMKDSRDELPVLGTVQLHIKSAHIRQRLGTVSLHRRSVYAVVQYGREWLRLPTIRSFNEEVVCTWPDGLPGGAVEGEA